MEAIALKHFKEHLGTSTDEGSALRILSELPHPASVRWPHSQGGTTLLHYACRNGWPTVVQVLIRKYRSDPNYKNSLYKQTPLHYSCMGTSLSIVKCLVEQHGCSVNVRDAGGNAPLHIACRGKCLEVVKYLTAQKGCDLEATNESKRTPLYMACFYKRLEMVKHLMGAHNCNPLTIGEDGVTPLSVADTDTLEFMLTTGRIDKANLTCSTPLLDACLTARRSNPLKPTLSIFVLGNALAGKSTLVKAIENTLTDSSLLGPIIDSFRRVSGVEPNTAGIKPVHIENKKLGHIILYDFAGQYEYYSSHAASMQSLLSSPGAIMVLLVVDLSNGQEEISRTLHYWASFIANHCSVGGSKLQVVLVGSHADIVSKRASLFLSSHIDSLQSFDIKDQVAINCTKLGSPELKRICSVIVEKCSRVGVQFGVNIEAHLLFHLLKECCKKKAYTLTDLSKEIPNKWKWRTKHKCFIATLEELAIHLRVLSKQGQIIFLENNTDIGKGWIILQKELLLAEINGTIFAPETFAQHHDVSNSTGVVPLSKIKEVFPTHDPESIAGLLCHLQYCHEIVETEAALISQGLSSHASEKYFFFPALVQIDRPTEACQIVTQNHLRCGWISRAGEPTSFCRHASYMYFFFV